MANYVRSTDRDLLVAQRVLGGLRYHNRKDLVEKAQVRDLAKAKTRFVQEAFGDGTLRKVQPKKDAKIWANYDMRVSFQLNNIPHDGRKYKGVIHFQVKDCAGEGMTKAACLQDAKERFRQYLVTGLRTSGTNLRKHFTDNAIITWMDGTGPVAPSNHEAVAEVLRKWIGNELWKSDTKIRKSFPSAVKYEEVRFTRICSECGIRKVTYEFNTQILAKSKRWVCLACKPMEKTMPEDETDAVDESDGGDVIVHDDTADDEDQLDDDSDDEDDSDEDDD